MNAPEKLGRFGHHPDPAIDFCVEVEGIEGLYRDVLAGQAVAERLQARLERAMQFCVGGNEGAVAAKATLRKIEGDINRLSTGADPLRFDTLRRVNISRSAKWHPGGIDDWSLADWAVASAGEMGEVCEILANAQPSSAIGMTLSEIGVAVQGEVGRLCDAVKKLNRERDGLVGNKVSGETLRSSIRSAAGMAVGWLNLLVELIDDDAPQLQDRPPRRELTAEEKAALGQEISDTVIYLDDLAARAGIDLGAAVRATFNAVSERNGFPERL